MLIYGNAYTPGFVVQPVVWPRPVDLAEPLGNEVVQPHEDQVQNGETLDLIHAWVAYTLD